MAIPSLTARLLLDEDVNPALATLLRQDGFDVRHVDELGRSGLADEDQLAFSVGEGCVLVTHNRDDFLALARDWWTSGWHHTGIVYARQQPLGTLRQRLLAFLNQFSADELRDIVLPLEAVGQE